MNNDTLIEQSSILNLFSNEKKTPSKGKLKIFFGSSAGVGKTYAMLTAAREQMEKGLDVLAGVVETHGRPETESLLEGLRIMQPLEISYRGLRIKEFDLETALTRHPEIILIDELAHTNAQGCRHPKRWNDVMELIDAGIDVFTTLNVQHIESLSDLISGSTGIVIKETVPDMIFDIADDVVLVDLDEDDLIRRLHEGKVYVAEGAMARAAENFFKKSNLSALREIALRRTADRVDAERSSIDKISSIALTEKLLVCIALNASSAKLLRTCKRMANALKSPWQAVFVDNSGHSRLQDDKSHYLESLERMVERMGGDTITLRGQNIAEEITNYAKKNGFTKIIVGKSVQPSLKHFLKGFLADRIIRHSGLVDVYVVTDDVANEKEPASSTILSTHINYFDFMLSGLAALIFTIPGFMLPDFLMNTDQALLYIVGSILIAQNFGFGPSLLFSILASTLFNYFFIDPVYQFNFTDHSYLVTFCLMLSTGIFVSLQVSNLNSKAISAREKESRMREFYLLTRELAATRGRFPVSDVVAQFLAKYYDVDVSVWMSNSDGHPSVILGTLPEETYYKDFGALQWCFENAHNAGIGTTTMPRAAGFYLPLLTSEGVFGVIGIFPRSSIRSFTKNEVSSFETTASLLASALDRVRSAEVAQQIMIEKEPKYSVPTPAPAFDKPVNPDLLSAFSTIHIRPMETITTVPEVTSANTIQNIKVSQSLLRFFEAERAKIWGSKLNKRPASLIDRVHNIIEKLKGIYPAQKLEINLPADLPDIMVDCMLTEQMLYDFVCYGMKRSVPFGSVSITGKREGSNIMVRIQDKGPSLSGQQLDNLINRFPDQQELAEKGMQPLESLSVPASMVRLHGGQVNARNRAISGIEISFTLPIA